MTHLATSLSILLQRLVVDRTGLSERFDFDLEWKPVDSAVDPAATPAAEFAPSLLAALDEQLGLKLESQRAPIEYVVIDYIQLIRKTDHRLQHWEHMQTISSELKNTINVLDIPLIGISQLNRSAIEGGGASNPAGAFKFVQDADMVMELRSRTNEAQAEDPTAKLHLNIEFSRPSQQDLYFKLLADPQTLKIQEV